MAWHHLSSTKTWSMITRVTRKPSGDMAGHDGTWGGARREHNGNINGTWMDMKETEGNMNGTWNYMKGA